MRPFKCYMRPFFISVLSLAFVLTLMICGVAAAPKNPTKSLTITTGGVGGGWYPIGGGIAHIINPKIKQFGYRSGAVPGGGVLNPARVGMGEADLGISQAPFLVLATKGSEPYSEKFTNLRAIAKIFDQAYHYAVEEGSGITSIRQMVEKKAAMGFAPGKVGTSTEWLFGKVMEAYGAPVKTLEAWGWKIDYGGQAHQLSQYRDKHVNGFCMHTQVPNSATMEAALSRKTRFLGIDDDVAQTMKDQWGTKRVTIPANTYENQTEDIHTITMPNVLFTSTDVPDEVVYEITKTMFEKAKYLIGVHVAFKGFNLQSALEGTGIALHPGAEKYYREAGALK